MVVRQRRDLTRYVADGLVEIDRTEMWRGCLGPAQRFPIPCLAVHHCSVRAPFPNPAHQSG